jgi:hypothetical protein
VYFLWRDLSVGTTIFDFLTLKVWPIFKNFCILYACFLWQNLFIGTLNFDTLALILSFDDDGCVWNLPCTGAFVFHNILSGLILQILKWNSVCLFTIMSCWSRLSFVIYWSIFDRFTALGLIEYHSIFLSLAYLLYALVMELHTVFGLIVLYMRGWCFLTLTHGHISMVKFAVGGILVLFRGKHLLEYTFLCYSILLLAGVRCAPCWTLHNLQTLGVHKTQSLHNSREKDNSEIVID